MRPMTPALVLMSLLWILGGSFFLSRQFCPATAAASAPTTSNLSLIDGDFKATSNGTYHFPRSSATLAITEHAKENYFKKTATYLADNPGKMLALTGAFSLTENNKKTGFGNLGIARAEAVKTFLVENGASEEQISTKGVDESDLEFFDKKLYNSVMFEFTADNGEATSTNGTTLNFDESKTVYFEPNQVDFPADDPKLLKIIEYLESYLTTNPDAIVTVNGYTDNQGSLSDKMKIAAKRADRVRRILRNYKKGRVFTSPMIVAKAVGPQDPQADNETEEGIAINNRVTLTVE